MTSTAHGPEKGGNRTSRDRRKNFRVDCPVKVRIIVAKSPEMEETRLEAQVLNLSLGGIGVRLDEEAVPSNLSGRSCTILFLTAAGRGKRFPGRFVGIYRDRAPQEGEPTQKTLEAGIRFEGLSMDDQFALVDLFGKIHTPLSY